MKKLRRRWSDRVAGFVADWPIPRQLAGQSVMGEAAQSSQSRTLRPRLDDADRVGTSICPFCAVGCAQLVYAKNGKPIHIDEHYGDAEDHDGVFSGFDAKNGSYTPDTWQYKGDPLPSALAEHYVHTTEHFEGGVQKAADHSPPADPSLQHPNCVYQIMRRHFARYTPEMVERVTGCPRATFLSVCEALTRNSGRERTGAFCYAVGWTHHACGVQIIRAASIIQGLLGNIGRPGGGVLALRGHCSIQGSTDIPTLYNMLPTYLPQPNAFNPHQTLDEFLDIETVPTGWRYNLPKYMISLLKAWYGEHAQRDNQFCYQLVPKLTGDHSQLPMTLAMSDGVMKGQFIFGQNPVVGSVNSELVERGLAKLDWWSCATSP